MVTFGSIVVAILIAVFIGAHFIYAAGEDKGRRKENPERYNKDQE